MPHSAPSVLLVRAGPRVCALPAAGVVETLRPLLVAPLPGTPATVLGAAVVRGAPVPVLHLDRLLGGAGGGVPSRWVMIRCGERTAALAVDAVLGVRALDGAAQAAPVLGEGQGDGEGPVAGLAAIGQELLVLLREARLVPDEAWTALDRGRA